MVDFSNKLYLEDISSIRPYLIALTDRHDKAMLITGATGLIGSFLVDSIREFNRSSISGKIRLYITTRNKNKVMERFGGKCHVDLSILEQDICNGFPGQFVYDYIIHLASNADPESYSSFPYETIKTNIAGAMYLSEYLKEHKKTRAVITSTMEVYGETDEEKITEQDFGRLDFNRIRAGYPESKRIAELLIRSAVQEYGISCVIARLGYIYGPTMRAQDNKIMAEMIRRGKNGKPIELRTSGAQRRTYCYVSDTASALLCLLNSGMSGEVYNVADKKSETTIKAAAELICRITATECSVNKEDMERTITDAVLDASKLEGLGWEAQIHLEEGLRRTLGTWIPDDYNNH